MTFDGLTIGSDNSSRVQPFCHVMFVHANFRSQVLTCSKATCYTTRLIGIKMNPIRTNKNNTHTRTNVRIWGSNPPVVNIIIIYIECSNMVPSPSEKKKYENHVRRGHFHFFSKTNCSAVAPFLFELYGEIKYYD